MKRHLIPASVLSGIIDMAVSQQIGIEDLLSRADIDPALVGSGDAFLTLDQFEALLGAMIDISGDPAFGLHYGENNHYHGRSIMVDLVYSAHSWREALIELVKYKDLVIPHAQFQLDFEGDLAVLSYFPGGARLKENQAAYNEIILTRIVAIGRWLNGGRFPLTAVHFTHSQPPYIEEYQRIFNVPVLFNAEMNRIFFEKHSLDEPLPGSLPDFHNRVEQLAEEKLNRLAAGYRITRQVVDYIEKNLSSGGVGIEEVASHLNMTSRTLQRKLKLENTSFAELRDRLRQDMAQEFLREPSIGIGTVASRLGFSDASTFYHAFKRWEGVSPGEYRKQQLLSEYNDGR